MNIEEEVKEIEINTDKQKQIIALAKRFALEMVGEDTPVTNWNKPTEPNYQYCCNYGCRGCLVKQAREETTNQVKQEVRDRINK